MLHIICNGKPVQLPDGIGLQDAANQLQPTASVTIRNGFQTSENCILADGDSITLIEKGVLPPRDVLEHMMAARAFAKSARNRAPRPRRASPVSADLLQYRRYARAYRCRSARARRF